MSDLVQKHRKGGPVPQAIAGASAETPDGPKKWEILDGARRVFRAEGFDGASMDKIARAAGVSKGTLYVYFRNKEELFTEMVSVDRREAAEQLCNFDDATGDVRAVLQRVGESFVGMMIQPDHIALIRMVMGAAEKFPEAGQLFFEMGPRCGISRLAAYLQKQVEAGTLRIDEDIELAAAHFLNLCQGNLVKPLLFNAGEAPSREAIHKTVASAVRLFLKSYAPAQNA
ncbi:MAG: TetR/AcrR family transcriptional regulator [Kiloniellaceae bacterium]